ncbi:Caspase-3 [Clonorchis sinensis]|uniref:Caspase-3 n=1 Tax=Clonorchis sinensis TaxID=79923 RepID=A0A419PK54_CLOSI|nr:Caspase-3 [Clonorchis sinensis]
MICVLIPRTGVLIAIHYNFTDSLRLLIVGCPFERRFMVMGNVFQAPGMKQSFVEDAHVHTSDAAVIRRRNYFSKDYSPPTVVWKLSAHDVYDPDLYYPIYETNPAKRIYRGQCFLINQRDFLPETGQACRYGTDKDADRVERLFKRLGYHVQRYFNVNQAMMQRLFHEASTLDHSCFDSFVCFILSHGENGMIYATDGPVSVEAVVSCFRGDRCPTLIGKPKLFFLQACRGTRFDEGVSLPLKTDALEEILVTKLPSESDILLAHSTVPGYFAWRNSASGSWFIQELCKILEDDLTGKQAHDILTLLTVVARCVAYQYRSNTGRPDSRSMVQMTDFSSTLTRRMFLTGSPRCP